MISSIKRYAFLLSALLFVACDDATVDKSLIFPATPGQLEALTIRLEKDFRLGDAFYSPAGSSEQTIYQGGYLVAAQTYGPGIDGYPAVLWVADLQGSQHTKVAANPFLKGPNPADMRYKVRYGDFENGPNLYAFIEQQKKASDAQP